MNDRIRLAEAMGWKDIECGLFWEDRNVWHGLPPNETRLAYKKKLPDPFTDANDCEALIRFLNDLGYTVEVDWRPEMALVGVGTANSPRIGLETQNWKQGVCELSLKVLP